jgi:hypothetical protein
MDFLLTLICLVAAPDPWANLDQKHAITAPAPSLSPTSGQTPNRSDCVRRGPIGAGVLETEAEAIDRRAVERYGWKLCQGSCGMICASHGGGLKWQKLLPGQQPDRGEAVEVPVEGSSVTDEATGATVRAQSTCPTCPGYVPPRRSWRR